MIAGNVCRFCDENELTMSALNPTNLEMLTGVTATQPSLLWLILGTKMVMLR